MNLSPYIPAQLDSHPKISLERRHCQNHRWRCVARGSVGARGGHAGGFVGVTSSARRCSTPLRLLNRLCDVRHRPTYMLVVRPEPASPLACRAWRFCSPSTLRWCILPASLNFSEKPVIGTDTGVCRLPPIDTGFSISTAETRAASALPSPPTSTPPCWPVRAARPACQCFTRTPCAALRSLEPSACRRSASPSRLTSEP